MNVAYLCFDRGIPVLGHKGASVHVREFAQALATRGHRMLLLCSKLGEGNPPPDAEAVELAARPGDDEIVRAAAACGYAQTVPAGALRSELQKIVENQNVAALAVRAFVDADFTPDLIYERSALFSDAGITIARRAGVPRILEVNAPLVQEQAAHRELVLLTQARESERRSYLGADHVVAVSGEVAAHVESIGVSRRRITVLPNGVDERRFSPQIDGSALRAELGGGRRAVIAFVGSLKAWHGVELLLEALTDPKIRRFDPLLTIVGMGPEYERLQRLADRDALRANVHFAGHVPHAEIPRYLAASDFTVAPYRASDGFYFSPMKIVESLACGRPAVAPRIGQIPELIAHGQTGLLYDPHDPRALAGAIGMLLSRPVARRAMGERAAAWALGKRTWSRNAETIEAIAAACARERALCHAG
jgi:glycosyltransferase involved in cell wall biosynthesis